MKKLIFLLVVAICCSATSYAQSGATNETGMFLEGGIGFMKAKASKNGHSFSQDLDGVALDLGLGYRQAINPYVAWDAIKFKVMAALGDFSETINPQVLTGIRGTTPVLFSEVSAYGSLGLGIGYWIDPEKVGFCYDFQFGLNVTRKVSVGFAFSNQRISIDGIGLNLRFFGAKVGYSF